MDKTDIFCATCNRVEVDHEGDDCDECEDEHQRDLYWESRMDWEREKELL